MIMLKALIKKQLTELFKMYFVDSKTGAARVKGKTISFFTFFVVVLLGLAGFFYKVAEDMAAPLYNLELGWFFYALVGLMAAALGIFGSVFNTYASLYKAKDNDLLLSMPIKPSAILLSRMITTYIMCVLYEAVVFVPGIFAWWKNGISGITEAIYPILLVFILGFVVLALTCLFGWIIAAVTSKLKNNKIITVILSLAFMAAYYLVWGNLSRITAKFVTEAKSTSADFRSKAFITYIFGMGAKGNSFYMLIFTVIAIALLLLTCLVMARSFMKIVTTNRGEKKKAYKQKSIKTRSVKSALLHKEFARFFGSVNYMLNGGFGVILMIVAAVAILIKNDLLSKELESYPMFSNMVPLAGVVMACAMCSMSTISAPSVSLEGKNLWIIKSSPIRAYDILLAKARLQIFINILPAEIFTLAIGIISEQNITVTILMCTGVALYNSFFARIGVIFNLKYHNLTWTNEAIPMKQGMSVIITMFIGLILSAAIGILGYFSIGKISMASALVINVVIFALLTFISDKILKTRGEKELMNISN
jgi:ABC-2 type transport system permease protein